MYCLAPSGIMQVKNSLRKFWGMCAKNSQNMCLANYAYPLRYRVTNSDWCLKNTVQAKAHAKACRRDGVPLAQADKPAHRTPGPRRLRVARPRPARPAIPTNVRQARHPSKRFIPTIPFIFFNPDFKLPRGLALLIIL